MAKTPSPQATAVAARAVVAALELKRSAVRSRLLDHLARGPIGSRSAFAAGIAASMGPGGAAPLSASGLKDFDQAFLDNLRVAGVLRHSDAQADDWLAEQAAWFFTRFDATHALWVGDRDTKVLAVNLPTLMMSATLELELQAAQRLMVKLDD